MECKVELSLCLIKWVQLENANLSLAHVSHYFHFARIMFPHMIKECGVIFPNAHVKITHAVSVN